jgi:hypothetical protein
MKKILLVFPSYRVDGIDDRLKYVLEQSGVLPPDLNEYSISGYKYDMMRIQSLFVNVRFDDFRVLDGEVQSSRIDEGVRWLTSPNTEVAAFVFCGHGKNEGSPDHGTLVCSFNQLYSAKRIEEHLSNYNGTFLRILNMCEATGIPCCELIGQSLRDSNASTTQLPVYRGITLMATSPYGETYGGSGGSSFIFELSEMVKREGAFRYENLRSLPHTGVCKITHPLLMGLFGEPATFAPVSVAIPESMRMQSWHMIPSSLPVISQVTLANAIATRH